MCSLLVFSKSSPIVPGFIERDMVTSKTWTFFCRVDMMTITTDPQSIQLSNNLDGILRYGFGSPIPLDPRDFRHQAYHGEERYYPVHKGKLKRYVFKGGILVEMYDHSVEAAENI